MAINHVAHIGITAATVGTFAAYLPYKMKVQGGNDTPNEIQRRYALRDPAMNVMLENNAELKSTLTPNSRQYYTNETPRKV